MDEGPRRATLQASVAPLGVRVVAVAGAASVSSGSYSVPEAWASIWVALVEDIDAAVLVVDSEGIVIFSNSRAMACLGKSVPPSAGKRLIDLWDGPVADERLAIVRQVAASAKPITLEGLVQGRWCRMSFRPLPSDSSARPKVLIVSCLAAHGSSTPSPNALRAKADDPGPFAALTPRELQILKMIGAGLDTSEIAQRLDRAAKTIEWHRVSLGNKLGAKNRVDLARIAINAGLVDPTPGPAPESGRHARAKGKAAN